MQVLALVGGQLLPQVLTLFGKGLYLAHLRIDCFLLLVWFILGDWQLGGMGQLLLVEFDLFGQL